MIRFLRTGAIAGAIGGLALALFLLAVGETTIDDAIALEEANAAAAVGSLDHGPGAEEALFTRGEQKVGGALGTVLVGVAFGAMFGIVFTAVRHRLPGRDDWQRALWLGGGAWLSLHLIPALKYPPNPPAVGDPDTVGERTIQFLLMMGVAIGALAIAWRVAIFLRNRVCDHVRLTAAALTWFAIVVLAIAVFPPNPDEINAPAQLIWHFRIKSLSGSLVSWAVVSCAFGALLVRLPRRATEPALT